jgi:electron transfer flavoprotein alpha/beta subunit
MAEIDMEALQADLDRVLEQRIAHLLGFVKAAKELVRGVTAADAELRRIATQRDNLDGRARRGDREARARIETLDKAADRVADGREKLLGDLQTILSDLEQ